MNQPQNTSVTLTYDVESVDPDGLVTMKVTFDEADLGDITGMGAMMGGMGAGGAAPLDSDLGLVGKSFTMKATPDGRVQEVRGMMDIVEEMTRKVTEEVTKQLDKIQLPPAVKAQMGQLGSAVGAQLRQTLGDSAMREKMEDMMTMYPETPVRVRSTWTKGGVRSYGMAPMGRSETWKLTGRKDGVLTLEVSSEITPNTDAPAMDMGFVRMNIELSGQQSGTVEVDEATGWIIRADMTYELDGTMKTSGGAMPGSQSMVMKVSGTSTIESFAK